MVMPCVPLGMTVKFIQQLMAPESNRHSSVFGEISVFCICFVRRTVIGMSSGACFCSGEGQ